MNRTPVECSLHTVLQTQHIGCCCQHCKPALSLHVKCPILFYFTEMCIFSQCLVKVPSAKFDEDPPSVVLTGWTRRHGDAKRSFSLQCELNWNGQKRRKEWYLIGCLLLDIINFFLCFTYRKFDHFWREEIQTVGSWSLRDRPGDVT